MPTVIHVSPHPDDESIAAPCTLLALRDAPTPWRVVNLAVSLGRPADRQRRRAELAAALAVAGFEHRELDPPAEISRGDDHARACRRLIGELTALAKETGAELVIGPHPPDGHHGHATVGRAIRKVVWSAQTPLTWWMWSVWADLPRPTLVVACRPDQLATSARMLEQHAGENRRNDYRLMHEPIRTVNAVRGIEKTFGFGTTPGPELSRITHAELLTEVTVRDRSWLVGAPRVLDPPPPQRTGWSDLDDRSILSGTRWRSLYHPVLLSLAAEHRVAPPRPLA